MASEPTVSINESGVSPAHDGRELKALVQAFDWSRTPLGPMASWPRTLQTLVDLLLVQPIPMIVLWGPELTQIYNDAWAVVAGSKHPNALGQANRECWPEVRHHNEPIYERVLRGERVMLDDHLIPLDRQGKGTLEDAYFTLSYSPAFDDESQIGGIFVTVVETTDKVLGARDRERRLAEDQLRRGYETFYNLIRDDPFGVYIVDADFRLAHVSRGAQKVFENVRPLIGRDFAEILRILWPEPFVSEVISRFRHTLSSGEPYVEQRTVERRNDVSAVEAYDWRIGRITLPDGRPGVVCYFYDLSERQRWEAALRTSEERLTFSIEAGELGTFYCPMPLGTIVWNAKCKEHFWLPPDAEVNMDTFYAVLHPDDRERTRIAVENAVFERHAYDIEYRTVAPDGRTRWVRAKGRAYYGENGQPTRFDGVTLDITEQKQADSQRQSFLEREQAARAQAEQAGRMKDEFLATLSHELRTPLNAILGWSQILRTPNLSSPEDMQQGLETIERNARAQTAIIEDLLDMSRIISGKVRLDVQRIDLPPVVRAAVDTVTPAAQAKGVRLQVVLDSHAGPVSGDPNRLQQVFWNLLTNAIKFTPKGGRVQIVLERVNSHLEVSVIDSGEGITPEFLPFVFDRFRQSDASKTRQHGGLGLGLAIVKQLVEMHGGSVRAKSSGVGQGAVFSVALPLTVVLTESEQTPARRHPSAPVVPITPKSCDTIAGLRVLVVDDEPDARALVRRVLEDCDVIVSVAASAAEAIERLETERPDVLVSDIGMPGEDGFSLMRRIRALGADRGGNTPAVALTAYARAEDRMDAVIAGFQHHIAKPVEPAELITMVASLAKKANRD